MGNKHSTSQQVIFSQDDSFILKKKGDNVGGKKNAGSKFSFQQSEDNHAGSVESDDALGGSSGFSSDWTASGEASISMETSTGSEELEELEDMFSENYRSSLLDVGSIDFAAGEMATARARMRLRKKRGTHGNVIYTSKHFYAEEEEIFSSKSGDLVNTRITVHFKDYGLSSRVQNFDVMVTHPQQVQGIMGLFAKKEHPWAPLESALMRLPQMKKDTSAYYVNGWKDFVEFLEMQYVIYQGKVEKFLQHAKISYDTLWYLFAATYRFYADVGKATIVGSVVDHARYTQSMFSQYFEVRGGFIKSAGTEFYEETRSFVIGEFRGLMDVRKLPIQPMSTPAMRFLSKRGYKISKMAIGHRYLHYTGYLRKKVPMLGYHYTKADGRIMIDIRTFNQKHPSYGEFESAGSTTAQQQQQQQNQQNQQIYCGGVMVGGVSKETHGAEVSRWTKLKKADYFRAWPFLAGFSFAAKEWGEIRVENVSKIQFDEHAYSKLVLPSEKKKMIKALVEDNHRQEQTMFAVPHLMKERIAAEEARGNSSTTAAGGRGGKGKEKKKSKSQLSPDDVIARVEHGESDFADLISGKGGGLIFLLHGPPGVGKTLTAEAVAEHLHSPLYSVSVGELGTTTQTLEAALNSILELAAIWGAVVLIDEADIFLEARAQSDVLRNAMVGIFLRKLEYHQGVLFLTTNRVSCFDHAFSSRISVSIKYTSLDARGRARVWRNLLHQSRSFRRDISKEDCIELGSSYEMNGRQIRSVIRLAIALARSEDAPLTIDHIRRTVDITSRFDLELKGDDEPTPPEGSSSSPAEDEPFELSSFDDSTESSDDDEEEEEDNDETDRLIIAPTKERRKKKGKSKKSKNKINAIDPDDGKKKGRKGKKRANGRE